jgi:hypothetical protein
MEFCMAEILENIENTICEFLASGESAAETAKICGVSIEKIQELLKSTEFRDLVKARGVELRGIRIEARYAKTEEALLTTIEKEAKSEFAELPALCRALEVIAKNRVMYRNPAGLGQPAIINNNVVTLLLPQGVGNEKILMNGNAEIVAIGDRNMASMPIDGVKDLFGKLEDKRNEKKEDGQAKEPRTYNVTTYPATATAGS